KPLTAGVTTDIIAEMIEEGCGSTFSASGEPAPMAFRPFCNSLRTAIGWLRPCNFSRRRAPTYVALPSQYASGADSSRSKVTIMISNKAVTASAARARGTRCRSIHFTAGSTMVAVVHAHTTGAKTWWAVIAHHRSAIINKPTCAIWVARFQRCSADGSLRPRIRESSWPLGLVLSPGGLVAIGVSPLEYTQITGLAAERKQRSLSSRRMAGAKG